MEGKIRNPDDLPVTDILKQMTEMRPLPMGRKDFDDWAARIISGALVPGAQFDDQKYALGGLLMHIGPTESHKPDAHFIHALRVAAIKQVAHSFMQEEYFKKHPEKLAEKKASEAAAQKTEERIEAKHQVS